MDRKTCLDEAANCICRDRETQYGTPEDNFAMIAKLWSTAFSVKFTAADVALAMVLLKVARVKTGTNKWDSFVDICGYAACACEIAGKAKETGSAEDDTAD